MQIKDKIYGEEKIKEPVLIELIYSQPMQRLKKIAQFGIPDEYHYKKGFSRYEHSLGCLVLLKRLNANLEEQVAGLTHDISHTVFSHVIDWVIGDSAKEDYQDSIHENFIKNSEIKKILGRYGFDYKRISNFDNFSLLERPAPGLCIDRIDYCLRELWFDRAHSFIKNLYLDLENKNNQIIFKTREKAEIFAREYARLQRENWGGDQARTRYYILANILKKALDNKLILFEDFNKTDNYVLDKLNNSREKNILDNLNLLKKGFNIIEDKNGIELKKKFRYIDPEILVNGSFKRLSELSKNYFDFINLEKQNNQQIKKVKYFIKQN